MRWKKTLRSVSEEDTTICYELPGCPMRIESRKRHIPHANGSGTWDHPEYYVHTEYYIMRGDEIISVKHTLEAAKRLAERYVMNRGLMEESI